MNHIINLLKFYYRLVGRKLFLLVFLMIAAVGFQGLSVSLFLPILQGEDSNSKIAHITKKIFEFCQVEYTLFYLLLFLVVLFTLRSLFLIGQSCLVGKIMADLLVDLRCKTAEKIFHMDYQAFLSKSSGYLNNALIVEFQKVVLAFKMCSSLLVTSLFALMYISIPLLLEPMLILFVMAIAFPLLLIIRKINRLTRHYSVRSSSHSAGLQNILIQSLHYYKYLKATSGYPNVLKQIFHQSKTLGKLNFRLHALGALTQYGFEPFAVLIIAGALFHSVEIRGLDIIEIIFLLFMLHNAIQHVLSTQISFRKLLNSWGSIEVLKYLESELERFKEKMPTKGEMSNVSFYQPIKFENVSFSFANGKHILKDINIEIASNSTVAFVGETGAGR